MSSGKCVCYRAKIGEVEGEIDLSSREFFRTGIKKHRGNTDM